MKPFSNSPLQNQVKKNPKGTHNLNCPNDNSCKFLLIFETNSRFCEDNSPDVTVNGRTLNVLFRSNKRSKGGVGAECTATCISNDEASTSVPPTEPPTTTPTPATTAAPTTGLSHNGKEWIPRSLFCNTFSLPSLSPFLSKSETVKLKQ